MYPVPTTALTQVRVQRRASGWGLPRGGAFHGRMARKNAFLISSLLTSAAQGRTDRFIGSWLKRQPRDSVLLATKVAGRSERITWLREGGAGCRVDAANITASVEASLRRLGTDYVDLLQVHWPDRYVSLWGGKPYDAAEHTPDATPVSEQLAALASLVAAGKVRAIGVSNETTFGVTEWARAAREGFGPKICSIQNAYHLLCRVPFETDLAEACAPHNLNVGLLAYSPLAGGALTNKYATLPEAELANARFTKFAGYMARA